MRAAAAAMPAGAGLQASGHAASVPGDHHEACGRQEAHAEGQHQHLTQTPEGGAIVGGEGVEQVVEGAAVLTGG